MNMFKKNGGFTLVELIVVIAILAILAGVAIPVYSGYIKEANKTADDQVIEAINTAVAAAVSMEGKDVADASTYISGTFDATTGVLTLAKVDDADAKVDDDIWANFIQFNGVATAQLDYYKTPADVQAELDGGIVVSASSTDDSTT